MPWYLLPVNILMASGNPTQNCDVILRVIVISSDILPLLYITWDNRKNYLLRLSGFRIYRRMRQSKHSTQICCSLAF